MLARRLLMAARGGGGFLDVGYSMSADEVTYWQDQAALLDPLAYVHVLADSSSDTVPAGERWYLVNGWYLDAGSEGTNWFHRPADVNRALMLPENYVLATGAAPSTSLAFYYVCKPSLVTGSDGRYSSDPRGLYFDRMMQLGTLTRYQLGSTNTGSGQVTDTFPTDFTYGMVLHTSLHDVAWMVMTNSGATDGMLNLHNEISDSDRIRWAEPTLFPFDRTVMPKTLIQGASQSQGRATLTYVKLPGGW